MNKVVGLIAILIAPFFLSQCGTDMSAVNMVGPEGPTSVNGYYFTLRVAPRTIRSGNVVDVSVQVFDSAGNVKSGVLVTISGVSIDPEDAATITDASGMGGWLYQINQPGGSVVFITVTVGDKSLTAPVQVITGSEAAS